MTVFDDFTQAVQKSENSEELDRVWVDVEHAKSSGQVTQEEYDWLLKYAHCY